MDKEMIAVKRKLCALLAVLLMLCATSDAGAETMTALEAFESLLAVEETPAQSEKSADDYLDEIMTSAFAQVPADDTQARAFAANLEPLCRITNRDIAAYASMHDLKMAQVRNAYFKALANVLKAEIDLNPASEEKYRSVQLILALFIEPGDEPAKQEIRAQMTPESSRRIARQYGLPEQFVEFVVMDTNWNDNSWKNDNDWKAAANWHTQQPGDFDGITIGSRDSADSTLIADMQSVLISLGYLKGKADGVFGPRTQAAVLEFQLANGLTPTGTYTVELHDALNDVNAVARWDYKDDFWDSEDLDSRNTTSDTPNTPGTRNTPNTPDSHRTPNTPDSPNSHDTPDSPDTP